MKVESAAKVKYGVWGLIVGVIVTIIIGFAWGGWRTQGASETSTREALLATRAAICVAQFLKQPNYQEKLKEFQEYSSWKKAEFVEKGGWDKMPGETAANFAVAQACADALEHLLKK